MITVDTIRCIEQLAYVRPAWHELLRNTPNATFFHTPEWLECYWRHFGAKQSLRVLVLRSEHAVVGIVPLVVRSEKTKVGTVRFLTYPLDYWGSFYGPIGPEPAETLRGALQHLRRTAPEWDALELRWIDHEGIDQGQTATVLAECRAQPIATVRDQTAIIDLKGSWDDYLAAHSSKWRNNFKRWTRRLAELGTVEYLRYRPLAAAAHEVQPRLDLFDACEEIARGSWQGSSTNGTTLSHPAIRAFLRDAHMTAAQQGCLDLNLLRLNGRPVAFAYNYHYQGYVFGLRVGYDPALASAGVGNLVYLHAIQDSFARGDRIYDLGPGSLECKRDLLTRVQPMYFHSCFEPTSLRAQMLRVKRMIDMRCQALSGAKPAAASAPAGASPLSI